MSKPCERCGKCCFILGKYKCKHLVILKNNKTLCRIYKTRIGTKLGNYEGEDFECMTRDEMDYPCPLR